MLNCVYNFDRITYEWNNITGRLTRLIKGV